MNPYHKLYLNSLIVVKEVSPTLYVSLMSLFTEAKNLAS